MATSGTRKLTNQLKPDRGASEPHKIYYELFIAVDGKPPQEPDQHGYINPQETEKLLNSGEHFWLVLGVNRQVPFKLDPSRYQIKSVNVKPYHFAHSDRRNMIAIVIEIFGVETMKVSLRNDDKDDDEDIDIFPPDPQP
jgi:hypothetical protein